MSIPMPFTVHVSDDDIADLRARLARTRFPDQAPDAPWAYGTDMSATSWPTDGTASTGARKKRGSTRFRSSNRSCCSAAVQRIDSAG